jgi:hypothetical protein
MDLGLRFSRSPTGLLHARNQPVEGHVPETDAANREFAIHRAGPSAQLAPPLLPRAEFGRPIRFRDFRFTRHGEFSVLSDQLSAFSMTKLTADG